MNRKIIVGLSGGVDSSMSLLLLKKQGWQPIGITLRLPVWKDSDRFGDNLCCSPKAFTIAQKVCQKLNTPYYVIDARSDFRKEVVHYFLSQIEKGQTPNPCVICNRYFKFIKLFEIAKKLGIKYIASGHYARIRKVKNYKLLIAKDERKDQSYYLCFLPKEWLKRIIFPLGDYTKEEVYKLAKKEDFNYWQEKKQSQDFCYLGGQPLAKFLQKELPIKRGLIVNNKGHILGKHQGLVFYTLGQRKGIKLGGGPYYVKEFDVPKNQIIITKEKKQLYKGELILKPFNLFESIDKPLKVKAKVRYQQVLHPAVLYPPKEENLKIVFDQAILTPTPGQFCVFYQKEVCLGGGVIVK